MKQIVWENCNKFWRNKNSLQVAHKKHKTFWRSTKEPDSFTLTFCFTAITRPQITSTKKGSFHFLLCFLFQVQGPSIMPECCTSEIPIWQVTVWIQDGKWWVQYLSLLGWKWKKTWIISPLKLCLVCNFCTFYPLTLCHVPVAHSTNEVEWCWSLPRGIFLHEGLQSHSGGVTLGNVLNVDCSDREEVFRSNGKNSQDFVVCHIFLHERLF